MDSKKRKQLIEASRTPPYKKVRRVAAADSPVTPVEPTADPDLGHARIRKERYTSAEFMRLEWERIWTKVWLLGGCEQDLREPGDFICTDIGRESVLIVRQRDGGIKAFYNVCLHRGNRLRPEGTGSTDSFKCQYHHWDYDLDGSFRRIPDLDTFPQGAPPCDGIAPLPCEAWGGFVWFSLNRDVGPLADYLAPVNGHLDPYNFHKMALTRDITVEWDCNWKTSVHNWFHLAAVLHSFSEGGRVLRAGGTFPLNSDYTATCRCSGHPDRYSAGYESHPRLRSRDNSPGRTSKPSTVKRD